MQREQDAADVMRVTSRHREHRRVTGLSERAPHQIRRENGKAFGKTEPASPSVLGARDAKPRQPLCPALR